MNELQDRAYLDAIRRGKTHPAIRHWFDYTGIQDELREFLNADENKPSGHIPAYTQAEEELADVLIACMTELKKRGVDAYAIVDDKVTYNEGRNEPI